MRIVEREKDSVMKKKKEMIVLCREKHKENKLKFVCLFVET